MSLTSRKEYLKANYGIYRKASWQDRIKIVDGFCKIAGYHRKHALRLFNGTLRLTPITRKPRGKTYGCEIAPYLKQIWTVLDCPCGQRLEAVMQDTIDSLERNEEMAIPMPIKEKLVQIKSASIDRMLKREKAIVRRTLHGTTKPGSLLKKQIPVVLSRWDEIIPGYTELDLVAHCGGNPEGDFVSTLNVTDLATGWTEASAIKNKAQVHVMQGLKDIKTRLPFPLLGLDPDNGSEFINWQLFRYCKKNNIQFTRGRPGKKNDNAHIEEKNWTHIRKIVGYSRLVSEEQLWLLNTLYTGPWRQYMNFFQPVMKLQEKKRIGGHLKRRYDVATPYRRIMDYKGKEISKATKQQLQAQYLELNPAQLKRDIEQLIMQIVESARKARIAPKPLPKQLTKVTFSIDKTNG